MTNDTSLLCIAEFEDIADLKNYKSEDMFESEELFKNNGILEYNEHTYATLTNKCCLNNSLDIILYDVVEKVIPYIMVNYFEDNYLYNKFKIEWGKITKNPEFYSDIIYQDVYNLEKLVKTLYQFRYKEWGWYSSVRIT